MVEGLAPRLKGGWGFLRRQYSDILRGGLPLLWRKTLYLLVVFLFLPLVLLGRALSLLITVRIGEIVSYRIGHFAMSPELYLSKRDMTDNQERVIDLFFLGGDVSNQQLKKMWNRTLRISCLVRYAYICNNFIPGSRKHTVPVRDTSDLTGVLEQTQGHISFTTEEEDRGRKDLKSLGLPNGAPFVCVHGRDSGYLEFALPSAAPQGWGYHDYRDTSIDTYVPATEYLAKKGYFVFRTGVAVREPLNTDNPKVIDYAIRARTDFLDIYLGAKCWFFMCDTAGMCQVPQIFRRPTAWINYIPLKLAPTWYSKDIFLPKKLWSVADRRFLNFGEILSSEIGRFHRSEQYTQRGIEIVDNTPEEIFALATEMEQRLAGTWQANEGDEELQARFWTMFPPLISDHVFRSRIGAEFLRENRELMD